MKCRARSVNHDHILGTFRADRVRDSRRNNDADVVSTAMIIAIDKKSQDAWGETGAQIA
jgi:hypothetical protein